jgi:hypothetical protein
MAFPGTGNKGVATNQALSARVIWTKEHKFVADGVLAERE